MLIITAVIFDAYLVLLAVWINNTAQCLSLSPSLSCSHCLFLSLFPQCDIFVFQNKGSHFVQCEHLNYAKCEFAY